MSDSWSKDGTFKIKAPAKTNFWLHVLGRREDGFHEIDTRMVALSLADKLKLKWRKDEEVRLQCSDPSLPTGEENLVVQAVRALEKHCSKVFAVDIKLKKKIPSGAGLGGGSSDAAAVLLALNEMAQLNLSLDELAAVGSTIGSDIPFFVYGRPCDCRGRGEIVEPVSDSLPTLSLLLLKPGFGISAGWAYQRFGESSEYDGFSYTEQKMDWGTMRNDLERPVFEKFPVLGEMKGWLCAQAEVKAALLSGSGSTMLAVLEKDASGKSLRARALERYGKNTWSYLGETR